MAQTQADARSGRLDSSDVALAPPAGQHERLDQCARDLGSSPSAVSRRIAIELEPPSGARLAAADVALRWKAKHDRHLESVRKASNHARAEKHKKVQAMYLRLKLVYDFKKQIYPIVGSHFGLKPDTVKKFVIGL